VSSDIIMPDRYLFKNGKRDVDHAMPWDKMTLPPIHFGIKQPILIKLFQIVKKELLIMINLN
jgi:hypothetical protein